MGWGREDGEGSTGLVSAWQVRTEFLCVRIPTTRPGPSHSVTPALITSFVAVAVMKYLLEISSRKGGFILAHGWRCSPSRWRQQQHEAADHLARLHRQEMGRDEGCRSAHFLLLIQPETHTQSAAHHEVNRPSLLTQSSWETKS